MTNTQRRFQSLLGLMAFSGLVMAFVLGLLMTQKLSAQTTENMTQTPTTIEHHKEPVSSGKGLGLLGAGLAFGLGCLGAGIAAGSASSAAIGALSEKPSMFGTTLIFIGICEGFMIFGFVMALLIMGAL
jgi:V/A-type H+-transporting ATPase subunit K